MFKKRFFSFWLLVTGMTLSISAQTVQVITSEGIITDSEGSEIAAESINVLRSFAFNGGTIIVDGHGNFEGVGVDVPFDNVNLSRPVMQDFVLRPDVSGGYFIDFFGGVHPVGDAESFGTSYLGNPFSPLPAAVDLELAVNNAGETVGYYTLQNNGTISSFGAVPQLTGVRTRDAVSISISPNGDGYAIINSRGQLTSFGNAPAIDISIDLSAGTTVVDFSFTGTGNGYYVLDSSGIIHAAGDAAPIDVPAIVGTAIGLETGVTAGSIDNLPEDIGPIPTATFTAVPEPTATNTAVPQATNTPTAVQEPTSTNTPVANAPTNTPVPPTNTSAPVPPTNTPVTGETPTATPAAPTNTPAPVETPTNTPTPTPAQEVPTPTPTVTPVPPTPTPESPVEEIIPPGISSLMIGTWAGTATSSTESRNARITISVQNGAVVVRDELGTIFGTVSDLNMSVISPLNLTHQEPPLTTIVRSFTLSNTKDLGEPNFISGIYGEIDISNPFSPVQRLSLALELFRQ